MTVRNKHLLNHMNQAEYIPPPSLKERGGRNPVMTVGNRRPWKTKDRKRSKSKSNLTILTKLNNE